MMVDDFERDDAALTPLRRCMTNVALALTMVTMPAKIRPLRDPELARRVTIKAVIYFAVFLLCMILVDAPVMRAVGHLPRAVIWPFDQITDFGKSGWFLWPLGLLFLALAASPAPARKVSQAVLAAVMVRVGFLFAAIAVPGLFVT